MVEHAKYICKNKKELFLRLTLIQSCEIDGHDVDCYCNVDLCNEKRAADKKRTCYEEDGSKETCDNNMQMCKYNKQDGDHDWQPQGCADVDVDQLANVGTTNWAS